MEFLGSLSPLKLHVNADQPTNRFDEEAFGNLVGGLDDSEELRYRD